MPQTASTLTLFLKTGRLIRSRMEGVMPLPFAQCEVVSLFADSATPTMHDIMERFKITAPSATALVESLVRGGYLERKQDRADRRQVRLALTAKGRVVLKKVEARRNAVVGKVLSRLGKSDREDLNRILGKILSNA